MIEKNQKYIDDAMTLREKQSDLMEQTSMAKETSIRHQETCVALQRQLEAANNDTTSKEEMEAKAGEMKEMTARNATLAGELETSRAMSEQAQQSLMDLTNKLMEANKRAETAEAQGKGYEEEIAKTREEKEQTVAASRDRAESSAGHAAEVAEMKSTLAVQRSASEAAMEAAVEEEKRKWTTQVSDLEDKCRRLVEADGAAVAVAVAAATAAASGGSGGGSGGGAGDAAATAKKVKTAVNGVAGDVYTSAKEVFHSSDSYDGKFVLKQIKSLLKQATKTHSK